MRVVGELGTGKKSGDARGACCRTESVTNFTVWAIAVRELLCSLSPVVSARISRVTIAASAITVANTMRCAKKVTRLDAVKV